MTDLVKQLKYEAAKHKRPFQELRKTVCWQAADRITKLEARLEAAKANHSDMNTGLAKQINELLEARLMLRSK